MGIVGKAIEGGVCHDGIVEEYHPFVDVTVAGDYRRGSSVPLNNDLVEVISLLVCQSLETKVVYISLGVRLVAYRLNIWYSFLWQDRLA